jgi:hypothetical protein
MSLRKVFPQLLDTTGASDGQVLRYVEANSRVEFVTATIGGSSDTVQDNLNRLSANVTANVGLVSDNVDSASSNVTALSTNIDTVSGNVDSYATYANSAFGTVTGFTFAKIAVGTVGNVEANVASDQLTLVAGNNITINADAATDTLTFKAALSNAVNNYFIADGTTNAFTLTQAASSNLDVLVSVEGLIQSPNLHYQVDSTTLTLMNTLPLENGTEVMVRWIPNTAESAAYVAPLPAGMGTTSGYTLSGHNGSNRVTDIGKFSLSTDSGSADVGDLTDARTSLAGGSSPTHGYGLGGSNGINPNVPTMSVKMDKFSFSTDGSATNIGSLSRQYVGAAESMSTTHGFVMGHEINPGIITQGTTVDRYSFSSDANGTDNAELVSGRHSAAGHSSTTHGYASAGSDPATNPTGINKIDKFSFANGGTGTEVGTLTIQITGASGQHSGSHGYRSGGTGGPRVNSIEKFPFSSDTNGSDVGELTVALSTARGINSTTHGYNIGGQTDSGKLDIIQKFPFSSDSPASDVGELYQAVAGHAASVI